MTFRRIALTIGTGALVLGLAACSSSSNSETSSSAAPATAAPTSEAPTTAASAPVSVQAPFVTTDCALASPGTPSDAAPAEGTAFGSVTVNFVPAGVPIVTIAADAPAATALESDDIKVGTGPAVKTGDTVTANYCGIGMVSREKFDSSWVRGEPATFPLDQVIAGWSDGVPGMQVGGQRLLVIPGASGYGSNPPPGSGILPDETLVFVIELVAIA
jgi:hypothetical protein